MGSKSRQYEKARFRKYWKFFMWLWARILCRNILAEYKVPKWEDNNCYLPKLRDFIKTNLCGIIE